MFMGILPNSQFGDIAVVDVSGGISPANVIIGTGSNAVNVQNFAVINSSNSFLIKPASAPPSPIPACLS